MKLSKRQIHDLEVIIKHTMIDIDYNAGGSYIQNNSQGKIHKTDVASAERAIIFIRKLTNEAKTP